MSVQPKSGKLQLFCQNEGVYIRWAFEATQTVGLNYQLHPYNSFNHKQQMSSKIQGKTLLGKHHLSNDHALIMINNANYNSYEQEIEANLRIILKRYSHLDKLKVRNLLEELENNLELAMQILEEEEQACNKILEEKKVGIKKPLKLSQEEENQIFKQSFLKLYKKFINATKENEQLTKKNDSLKQENQKLKYMNKMLLEGEYSQVQLQSNHDIC